MFNSVILSGRLTADPELRTTNGGKAVTSFTIANEDGRGEEKQTSFIDIVAWQRTAENICRYFHRGDYIGIVGRLKTRSWDTRDGVKRKVTEVIATSFEFMQSNKTRQDYQPAEEPQDTEEFQPVIDDEDMPF